MCNICTTPPRPGGAGVYEADGPIATPMDLIQHASKAIGVLLRVYFDEGHGRPRLPLQLHGERVMCVQYMCNICAIYLQYIWSGIEKKLGRKRFALCVT